MESSSFMQSSENISSELVESEQSQSVADQRDGSDRLAKVSIEVLDVQDQVKSLKEIEEPDNEKKQRRRSK